MAQQKKHQPEGEKPERKPFAFMDRYEFLWSDNRNCWAEKTLGDYSWLAQLYARQKDFYNKHEAEFGPLETWCTITHAEEQIRYCSTHPVFSVDPDPIFLRKWLDVWVELQYCRLWCKVFDVLRLEKGVAEVDAYYRASELAAEFEALYDPTTPRVPQKPKRRRGSK
jgi:hypothetical protein